MNIPLFTALIAIVFAQVIKIPIAYISNRSKASIKLLTSTGGMPSSHSAAVASLIVSLLFETGFASPHVAIATVYGLIVMFDSMGVRRQSGEQGLILDMIARKQLASRPQLDDISLEDAEDINPSIYNYSSSHYDRMVIKRYLGHKPSEVIAGVITGSIVAVISRMVLNGGF